MNVFAHRAKLPTSKLENAKVNALELMRMGYSVELDVYLYENKLYLGHDEPNELIYREFLEDSRILVHAKTWQTYEHLLRFKQIHCFLQNRDEVSITSHGYRVWNEGCDKGNNFGKKDIVVDLSIIRDISGAYGIITDIPLEYQDEDKKTSGAFKLLVLDVDGVLTNGKKTYDKEHNVLSKEFCDRDFTAIKRFKSAGIPVVLLSGDEFNLGMANNRELEFYNARKYSNQLDKSKAIDIIAKGFDVSLDDIAYVGDDYYDLSALHCVGWAYCPKDAAQIVKDGAVVLNRKGGEGVIDALYETVKDKIVQRFPYE